MAEIITLEDGTEVREFSNGAQQSLVDGKIIKGPHPDKRPITDSASGRALAKRRWDKAREEAAEGMLRAAKSLAPHRVDGPPGAWGFVVERQSELAMSPDAGSHSVRAAEFVGRAAGMLAERDGQRQAQQVNVTVQLDGDAFRYLDEIDAT